MSITTKKSRGKATFIFEERVGIEDAASFLSLLKDNPGRTLSIDMSKADLIDTSIVQIILVAKQWAKKQNCVLQIIAPDMTMVRMLADIGFKDELRIN